MRQKARLGRRGEPLLVSSAFCCALRFPLRSLILLSSQSLKLNIEVFAVEAKEIIDYPVDFRIMVAYTVVTLRDGSHRASSGRTIPVCMSSRRICGGFAIYLGSFQ